MIKEDYVSFEIAKLLKEKGFDEPCVGFYNPIDGCFFESSIRKSWDYNRHGSINAPTHQMVMKWLREAHNIETSISYGFPFIDGKRVFKYFWCPVKVTEKGLEYPMDDPDTAEFIEGMADSYEQAVEAAIKYSLENLI